MDGKSYDSGGVIRRARCVSNGGGRKEGKKWRSGGKGKRGKEAGRGETTKDGMEEEGRGKNVRLFPINRREQAAT